MSICRSAAADRGGRARFCRLPPSGSAPRCGTAFAFFGQLFCLGGTLLYSRADFYDVLRYAPFLLLSALAATPLLRDAMRAICRRLGNFPRHAAALCGFVLALAYAAAGGYTPFLYASY